jgi:hypothetical protein
MEHWSRRDNMNAKAQEHYESTGSKEHGTRKRKRGELLAKMIAKLNSSCSE